VKYELLKQLIRQSIILNEDAEADIQDLETLMAGEKTLVPSLNKLNRWDDFPGTAPLSGRTGVGPGEDRLAEILGGIVQGQAESFDLDIPEGPLAGKWEVKAPDKSSEIRPGTEGITAFGPINKVLRIALDELTEFLSTEGIDDIAKAAEAKGLMDKIKKFMSDPMSKSGKTNADLIQSGEITSARFKEMINTLKDVSKLAEKLKGESLSVNVAGKDYSVKPADMLKISKLLGMTEEEVKSTLGETLETAKALMALNSKIFENPEILEQAWNKTISADSVFDLTGIILVTPEGFMMLRHPYGDKIKFSRVSQGKPKFKTPIKGVGKL
jgi:hypothetical protein